MPQKIRPFLCAIVVCLLACAASANPLVTHINRILNKFNENLNVGIVIKGADSGRTYYSRNADRLYVPASVAKIYTAASGLLVLGPDFRYKTKLLIPKSGVHHGVIKGNVDLSFVGDPDFSSADLFELFGMLAHYHVKTIKGNFIIDDSHYTGEPLGKGWMWDDMGKCYSAPVGANILDHNCLTVSVMPAQKANLFATIVPSQPAIYTPISNEIITRNNKKKCDVKVRTNDLNQYTLRGCIKQNQKEPEIVKLAITNPLRYTKEKVKEFLAYYHIKLQGDIIQGSSKKTFRLLAVHKSPPFSVLLEHMMKYSDDLYAESFAKSIGAKYFSKSGSWHSGMKAIRKVLKLKAKISLNRSKLVDGSGLSRYNLTTPATLSRVLEYIYRSYAVKPEFLTSLPIGGVDGTLRKRMHWDKKLFRVRAKSGTMKSVSALAGFVYSKHHGAFSFVIMMNGFTQKVHVYRQLQDKIVKAIADY